MSGSPFGSSAVVVKSQTILTSVKDLKILLWQYFNMKTTSEIAIVAIVWSMTSIGLFFSLRALIRKMKNKFRRPPTDDNSG